MAVWIPEFSSRFDLASAGLILALLILRVREARCSAVAAKLADPAEAALELRKLHYRFLCEACIAAMGFGLVARANVGFESPLFSLVLYTYLLSRNPEILPIKKVGGAGPAGPAERPPMATPAVRQDLNNSRR